MLVSGVFSSWLTVATRLLFTSSSKRNRVTSSSSTAAPSVAPSASRIGRIRGRNECVSSPIVQHDGLVETLGQVLALVLQDVGQRLPQRLGRLPDRGAMLRRPRAAARPNRRRAAGLAISTCCCGSTTSTGSGNESIVAWLVCCARINWALCDWRNSRSCRAMVLKALASCPSSSSEVMGTS